MAYWALQRQLRRLSALLGDVGEQHWAEWSFRVASQLAEGTAGPEQVRRAFGGMGSLNDLIVHPANGHHVEAKKVDRVNRKLDLLRSRVFRGSQVR